jgi:DNA-directed RNA polymerase subunit RPC12/RpoP
VLDATVPITDYDSGYVDGVEFGISTVSTMPTIQPQSTAGQLNDGAQSTARSTNLIDRKATIDAVNNAFDRETLLTGFVRSIAVRAIRDMPSAQPDPHEGHWIPHESPDGGEQYECSRCGVLWEFNDGTPEDNEAYFCPKCGAKMKGEPNE